MCSKYCGKQADIKNINNSLIHWNLNLTRLPFFLFAKFGNLTYRATHQDPLWNLPHFTGVLTSQAELVSPPLSLPYSALPNEKKKRERGGGKHEKGEMKGRKREKKRRQWGEEEEYIRCFKFRFMKLNFDDLLQNTETKILARFKEY